MHLPTEPAIVSITSSPSSPVMAGDNITLTCSVTLPTGVTGTPDIQWEGPGVSGQMVSSDLTLSEITTSQAGQYTCTATLSGSVSNSVNITVRSKLINQEKIHFTPDVLSVPVPTPSITVSNTDTVYAGTTLSLTCDYTLSPSVDTTPQTAVTWMVDGVAVVTSPGRISTDGATLSFSPPATSDTGNYSCTLTVTTSQTHVTVQGPEQSEVEDIIVQSKLYSYCR